METIVVACSNRRTPLNRLSKFSQSANRPRKSTGTATLLTYGACHSSDIGDFLTWFDVPVDLVTMISTNTRGLSATYPQTTYGS